MNTRRNFLIKGSLAATALMAVRPFNSIASKTTGASIASNSHHSLLLVHSGKINDKISEIKSFTNKALKQRPNTNIAVFNTRNKKAATADQFKTDAAAFPQHDTKHFQGEYEIIYKGQIKIGVITAGASSISENSVETVSSIAAYLKKTKNCDLVVCLSHLGFRNQNSLDDQKLAASSKNLDIIISSHPHNYSIHPFIALNKDNEEVIINHSSAQKDLLGKISLAFNDKREKINIGF